MNFQNAIRRVRRFPRMAWVAVALPVVWLAFGSTFIALKVGVASAPPFLFSGARFVVVGILLLAWSAWRAGWRLKLDRREVLLAAGTGVGMILVGQGTASWSAQYLDPGVVAVLTSTMPLWAALIGRLVFATRIALLGSAGLAAGFGGVVFLGWPGSGGVAVGPALLVVAGATGWAAAVVVASRSGILRRPALVTALQTLVGGGLQVVVGLVTGEAGQLEPDRLLAVVPAFAYLVAVPSIIGFVLFAWLLSQMPVHIANTAVYVAPVIALALGWLLLGEQVTPRTLGGVGVIVVGVALIVWSGSRTQRTAVAEPEPARGLERRAA